MGKVLFRNKSKKEVTSPVLLCIILGAGQSVHVRVWYRHTCTRALKQIDSRSAGAELMGFGPRQRQGVLVTEER